VADLGISAIPGKGGDMELCILAFKGVHVADEALKEMINQHGRTAPWLHDVGVVSRPRIGSLRIGASFPDGRTEEFREEDPEKPAGPTDDLTSYFVSSLAGPLATMFTSVNTAIQARESGKAADDRIGYLDEVRNAIARDGSGLVLVGSEDQCDAMVEMFEPWHPTIIRRSIAGDLQRQLLAVQRMAAKDLQVPAQADAASRGHAGEARASESGPNGVTAH
jgi:hypothetical protein